MITLRSFSNSAAAGIAQAVLRDHEILCELADVQSHLYSGAMIAIPVRLLVAEEDIEEARLVYHVRRTDCSGAHLRKLQACGRDGAPSPSVALGGKVGQRRSAVPTPRLTVAA